MQQHCHDTNISIPYSSLYLYMRLLLLTNPSAAQGLQVPLAVRLCILFTV